MKFLTFFGVLAVAVPAVHAAEAGVLKPRIVVLSDITPASTEPDDMESFVHLLASADMFEIEAIVATTGYSLGSGPRPELFGQVIDAYEKDLPNLMKRSGQAGFLEDETRQEIGYWPSPAYLRSLVRTGQPNRGRGAVGDGKSSGGSDLLVEVIDEDDERPVWVGMWGSGNTLAQSIFDVQKTRSADGLAKFLSKVRVYAITDQDRNYTGESTANSAQKWLRENFKFFYIWSESAWGTYGSTIKSQHWPRYQREIQGQGNLGRIYPTWKFIVEGDSPSFLYVWPGLNNPEDPSQRSFAGRFLYGNGPDGTPAYHDSNGDAQLRSNAAVTSTLGDQVNDFAARMSWAARGAGNRNPKLVIHNDASYDVVNIDATASSTVPISCVNSTDPDGDSISYTWEHDDGAGYRGAVSIGGATSQDATIMVPSEASGEEIHIYVRGVDNGTPPLASYRRIILNVS